MRWGLYAVAVLGLGAGGAGAWFLRPVLAPDARIAASARRAQDAEAASTAQKDRADALEKTLDATAKAKRDAEAKLGGAEATARTYEAPKPAEPATWAQTILGAMGVWAMDFGAAGIALIRAVSLPVSRTRTP